MQDSQAPPADPAAVLAEGVPAPIAPAFDCSDPAEELAKMPADIQEQARKALSLPQLVPQLRSDLERYGIAGESDTALLVYLCAISRHLDSPLWLTVQGPSSSGKTYVVERVAELVPAEAKVHAADMTQQALVYIEPADALRHRFIVGGERRRAGRRQDESAERTRHLRNLWSGETSILSPVKDRRTGRMTTERRTIKGPIAAVDTTTEQASRIDQEDRNRRILIHTDESARQTRRVLEHHAAAAAGLGIDRDSRERLRLMHHAMQRLLAVQVQQHGAGVLIPFAPKLSQLFRDAKTEARRSWKQVLSLIEASAVLHLFQRERDEGDIVATEQDYALARTLLLPSLSEGAGGLSESMRNLLAVIDANCGTEEFDAKTLLPFVEYGERHARGLCGELVERGLLEESGDGKHRGRTPKRWRRVEGASLPESDILPMPEQLMQAVQR
jgi:DNA primase